MEHTRGTARNSETLTSPAVPSIFKLYFHEPRWLILINLYWRINFFSHIFFRLHDEGPAGSSYPAEGKPTARMAVASAEAVGSAPLLRRGRAHGLAPDPVAGSRAVARARGCRAPLILPIIFQRNKYSRHDSIFWTTSQSPCRRSISQAHVQHAH